MLILPPQSSRLVTGDVILTLKREPSESFAAMIIDGPYGMNKGVWDATPFYPPNLIQESLRVLRDGGTAFVFGLPEILAQNWGVFPPNTRLLAWHYLNRPSSRPTFWCRSFDGIACFWKGDKPRFFADAVRTPYTQAYRRQLGRRRPGTTGLYGAEDTVYRDLGGSAPRDVITIPALAGGAGRKEGGLHVCQKPLALLRTLILSCTEPGDIVGDIFAGSGSTSVAALELGRRFVAIEKDPACISIAMQRLANAESRPSTNDGVPACGTPPSKPEEA